MEMTFSFSRVPYGNENTLSSSYISGYDDLDYCIDLSRLVFCLNLEHKMKEPSLVGGLGSL